MASRGAGSRIEPRQHPVAPRTAAGKEIEAPWAGIHGADRHCTLSHGSGGDGSRLMGEARSSSDQRREEEEEPKQQQPEYASVSGEGCGLPAAGGEGCGIYWQHRELNV